MKSLEKRFPRYRLILKLYPVAYQLKYGDQQLQTTADMLDHAGSRKARLAIWIKLALDTPLSVVRQQVVAAGDVFVHETPSFIKLNSFIAGALLLPFFGVLAANSLDKVINDRTLQNSWLWHSHALAVWLLRLPEVALLLAMGSYIVYVIGGHDHSSWLRRLVDFRRLWPVVISGGLAFGILFVVAFHDSGQCLAHTPGYLASHGTSTWQCFTNNSALRAKVFF